MLRTLLSATVATVALSGIAAADAGEYNASVGVNFIDMEGFTFYAASFRGGYEFTDYLGLEGQLDIGLGDNSVLVGATSVDVELDYALSAFAIARAPVAENVNLFGRIGYTTAEASASAAGTGFSDDDDGFAFGVGGEIFLDGRNGFRFDYTRIDFDQGGEADTFGLTFTHVFGAR